MGQWDQKSHLTISGSLFLGDRKGPCQQHLLIFNYLPPFLTIYFSFMMLYIPMPHTSNNYGVIHSQESNLKSLTLGSLSHITYMLFKFRIVLVLRRFCKIVVTELFCTFQSSGQLFRETCFYICRCYCTSRTLCISQGLHMVPGMARILSEFFSSLQHHGLLGECNKYHNRGVEMNSSVVSNPWGKWSTNTRLSLLLVDECLPQLLRTDTLGYLSG